MTATEYVVLVDNEDQAIGLAEKMDAHLRGLLHRAFSVFIFQHDAENITPDSLLLLQQRALDKYHSPGLWTNSCCSHPRDGEDILQAGQRRLQEELGFQAELKNVGYFQYIAHFENGLCENELDHVLVGAIDDLSVIRPNPAEVAGTRWVSIRALRVELERNPEQFTPWLKQALNLL